MNLKSGLFFSFCCIITPISCIRDHYCIVEIFFEKSRKNKNKLRTIYSKNHENFRNSKPRSNFTGSYMKKECKKNTTRKIPERSPIFANFIYQKICDNYSWSFFIIKLKVFYQKETPTQAFSTEYFKFLNIEVVIRRCSVKEIFSEIFQNSEESTCGRVSFLNFI